MSHKHPAILRLLPLLTLLSVVCFGSAVRGGTDIATKPSAALPAGDVGPAAIIQLTGDIDDYARDQLKVRFGRAKAAGVKTIILEIDTFGGLVTSGLDISRFIKNQQDVKVIAFVNSKAISAGAMIALACDEIVMTPSGTIGDCAPIRVAPSGIVSLAPTERSKAESPILADFQESAFKRGYSPLLAVSMVSLPYSVYWVQNDAGQRQFVDADEHRSLTASGQWKPVPGEANPIDGPTTLLTLHTDQALRYGLATRTATSADALAQDRGMAVVSRYDNGVGSQIIKLLGSTMVRVLLIIVFLNALFIGLKTPGTGMAEALAVVSLGVLVGVPLLTGYAEWAEILMIVAGIALIAFEVFVFPGHFVSIIAGGLLVIAGLMLTFIGDVWSIPGGWGLPKSWDGLQTGVQATVIGLVCSVLLSAWLRTYLPTLPYFKGLVLAPTVNAPDVVVAEPPVTTPSGEEDRWPFVGTIGLAVSDLKPGGSARFPYADDWRVTSVVSIDGYVSAGSKLLVHEVHGSNVVVKVIPA